MFEFHTHALLLNDLQSETACCLVKMTNAPDTSFVETQHTHNLSAFAHNQLNFIKMPAAKKKASSPQARKSKGKQWNEKLILGAVHGELVGTTWVDQKSRISQALVDKVTCKANCVEMFCMKTNGTDGSHCGQAGLIRGERLNKSPKREPAP